MADFCLVHGSAQGPAGWALLVRALEERGHTCVCVDLPTDRAEASALVYAELIGAAASQLQRPTVVAHSASGMFLPLVPRYADTGGLVYLAAVIPLPRQSFLSQVQADANSYRPDFLRVKPPIDAAVATHYLFHDCAADMLPWALSTVRMMHAKQAIGEECPLREWPAVPTAYISCSEDRTIHPTWWEAAARERLGIEPMVMEAGHAPFVSRPRELADRLCGLVR